MQLVGAGLRSARQDEPNHQKFSANSYARTHLTVGVDAYIDPAECTISTEIFGEFVTSQRADVGIGPYKTSVNSYCSASFERKANLPQLF